TDGLVSGSIPRVGHRNGSVPSALFASRELAARAVSDGAHITVQTKKRNMAVGTVDGNKMHVSVDTSASARMKLDSSDLEISDVAGSAKLRTHNEDILVENVAGQLPIRTHTAKSLSVI